MSNDHDLGFDDELNPELGAAADMTGSDDGGEDTTPKKKKLDPKLVRLQQESMAADRRDFAKLIRPYRSAYEEFDRNDLVLRREYNKKLEPFLKELEKKKTPLLEQTLPLRVDGRLFDVTHIAPWKDIWLLTDALQMLKRDFAFHFTVILGGWLGSQDKSQPPAPFSPEVREKLRQYAIYAELVLLGKKLIAGTSTSDAALLALVREHTGDSPRHLFDDSIRRVNSGKVYTIAKERHGLLQGELERFFLFMEHRRYWFLPVTGNMDEGWEDFYNFASDYNHMRPEFIGQLGPYNLSIEDAVLPTP